MSDTPAPPPLLAERPVPRSTYAGLALVALATLVCELALMRVFSVVLYYHFAIVAVSLALFGMTLGAVIVHLLPSAWKEHRQPGLLALACSAFALTLVGAAWALVALPWQPPQPGATLWALAGLYLMVAIPFTFSGIAVSLALTSSPRVVNRLYASDLLGAAAGCLLLGLLMRLFGPGALVGAAVLAALAGLCFSRAGGWPARVGALVVLVGVATFLAVGTPRGQFRVRYTKGQVAPPPEFEAWNAFSRVRVYRDPNVKVATGWGGSLAETPPVRQKWLDIDSCAGTVLTAFDGNPQHISFFRSDISALAHVLRPGGKALVIGTGGGRDVLISLINGQRQIIGVELNDLILRAVNREFGDFTGHLDRRPDVRFVNDEARSYIARSPERYDVIVCSLIDTWAATTAGAFVFSENGLYTVEAWRTFLDHLQGRGVLAVTRWYYAYQPLEVLRLVSLARAVLERDYGVTDVSQHVIVARRIPPRSHGWGVGTVLVSKRPFTAADRQQAERFCRRYGFELVVAPGLCTHAQMWQLLTSPTIRQELAASSVDLTAPTDDRPFFFHMLKPGPGLELAVIDRSPLQINQAAVHLLGRLLYFTAALTVLFVLLPLGLGAIGRQYRYRGLLPLLGFFVAIGLGFMLVEISQMQRLMIYLGHPIYGAAVVLFSLLLASGLGSLASKSVSGRLGQGKVMAVLVAVLLAFALLTPALSAWGRAWPTPARLALALATLLPMGFFMGMPFPLGMTIASRNPRAPLAWYWGVNGATSVLASVLAMAFSLYYGITVTCLLGVSSYLLATGCLAVAARTKCGAA